MGTTEFEDGDRVTWRGALGGSRSGEVTGKRTGGFYSVKEDDTGITHTLHAPRLATAVGDG
ncbi:hypothetical protein ABW17_12095 [Mycobacterium nebraskense]|uniref:hypothetical protein n=1 Tax=Mycobacterium nebraskense TaxID=244292 RepID=UPI000641C30E|nr:hypothetical protein [Mycobacterium nebraskense]KLO42378.1 hypothetical protein ABW17_12095 [Mycobacterium nebraskense]